MKIQATDDTDGIRGVAMKPSLEAGAPMRAVGQQVGQITGKRSNGPPAQKVQRPGQRLI